MRAYYHYIFKIICQNQRFPNFFCNIINKKFCFATHEKWFYFFSHRKDLSFFLNTFNSISERTKFSHPDMTLFHFVPQAQYATTACEASKTSTLKAQCTLYNNLNTLHWCLTPVQYVDRHEARIIIFRKMATYVFR